MVKLDEHTCRALLIIRNTPELQAFVEWLKARRETARDYLEGQPHEKVAGRAMELKELLEAIEGAPKTLESFRARKT